jgi:hypothetical protein
MEKYALIYIPGRSFLHHPDFNNPGWGCPLVSAVGAVILNNLSIPGF